MFSKCVLIALMVVGFSNRAHAETYKTEFANGVILVDTVKRTSDDTILVKGTITNTSSVDIYWPLSSLIRNGIIDVKLQELKTKKQFEQARVDGMLVGSAHKDNFAAGQSNKFWARITAPPKDVQKVTILFGGDVVPLDDVSISE